MDSFVLNDAIRFKLATQQEDSGAKIQVFFGVFIGVLLRWIIVDLIKNREIALVLNTPYGKRERKDDSSIRAAAVHAHVPCITTLAGIQAIVAEFYARIFYRNAVNGGYLIPFETGDRLCERICTGDELKIDVEKAMLHNLTTKEQWSLKPLGEVAPILDAGGVFPYARKVGMLRP